MLRGRANVSFWTDDHDAAKAWYTELGITPHFERPGYAEFRLDDYQHELGLIDRRYAPAGAASEPGGAIAYWHVDSVAAALERLVAMDAREYEALTERGAGFVTAAVIDPFGNALGLVHSPTTWRCWGAAGGTPWRDRHLYGVSFAGTSSPGVRVRGACARDPRRVREHPRDPATTPPGRTGGRRGVGSSGAGRYCPTKIRSSSQASL